jgi:protein transport protein SEC20
MDDNHVMASNQNLTDALRRTAQTMQEELEKSVLATQILGKRWCMISIALLTEDTESSTATIRSSTLQQEVLDTVMDVSRQLVKALEQADWLDRMLILAAVLFFALVVLFVLKQRIVDRGFRLVFWWTRFLPNTSGPTHERIAATATTAAEATTTLASMIGRTADEL